MYWPNYVLLSFLFRATYDPNEILQTVFCDSPNDSLNCSGSRYSWSVTLHSLFFDLCPQNESKVWNVLSLLALEISLFLSILLCFVLILCLFLNRPITGMTEFNQLRITRYSQESLYYKLLLNTFYRPRTYKVQLLIGLWSLDSTRWR